MSPGQAFSVHYRFYPPVPSTFISFFSKFLFIMTNFVVVKMIMIATNYFMMRSVSSFNFIHLIKTVIQR